MNKFENSLQNETAAMRLSPEEKAKMRAVLVATMRENPIPRKTPLWALFRTRSLALIAWTEHTPRLAGLTAAMAVALLVSSTAYAAEGALPGDLLYPIKISVNEQVAGALAISDAKKAAFNTEVAQTRIKEAEQLAAQNRLNPVVAQKLKTDFDTHVAQAKSLTEKVKAEDPGEGERLAASFSVSLSAQSSVLSELGNRADDKDTKEVTKELTEHVLATAATVSTTQNTTSTSSSSEGRDIAATSGEPTGSSIARSVSPQIATPAATSANVVSSPVKLGGNSQPLRDQVVSEIAIVEQLFGEAKPTLNEATSNAITNCLSEAHNAIAAGDEDVIAGRSPSQHYQSALKEVVELHTYLDAGKTFRYDMVPSLLNCEDSSSSPASER